MYCPKCSHIQSSDEMRFCSRCGFSLAGVAMLVVNDGVIPQTTASRRQPVPACRKRVMGEGAILTGVAWTIAIAATAGFDSGGSLEAVAKSAALLFFFLGLVGLLRFVYGFIFVKDLMTQPEQDAFPVQANGGSVVETPRRGALPVHLEMPAPDYYRRNNTREMVPQPSVTENTTRLLEETANDRND